MQPLCDDYFRELGDPRRASPAAVQQAVRAYLDACRAHLVERHEAGTLARIVNEEHTDLVDRLIRKLFRLAEDRFFADTPRLTGYRLAVVAVGGYGRREMSLASDVDLLFVYRGKMSPYVETLTESIVQRLWDARRTVGAAVRTLRDCRKFGLEDLPTLTSYLDARFLIGDPGLFAGFVREVEALVHADPLAFTRAKLEERRQRHERYGESLYLLQPNVREGVGGLRDYQTALWIAHALQHEVRRPEHLLVHGFVDARELEELSDALDFLWRVRNELHRAGRKDDRLHYEAQERLVERLGFRGTEHLLPIEQLMQSYYRRAKTIERVGQRAIDHALATLERRASPGAKRTRSLEEGFAAVGRKLEIPHASLLAERPLRTLSVFAVAQKHDLELSARAQRMVREHLHLIDDGLRKDPEAAAVLRRILTAPRRVYRSLAAMNDVGVLGAWLPEFGWLVGMWQHDLYHTYTVDQHSLFLVEQLRRLGKDEWGRRTLARELLREIRDPFVLYLGCLVHDIGKGRGGGHSARGAEMVGEVAARIGLNEQETETVRFLVLNHLTMSAMAERRDVHDPRLIVNLANLVETRGRLRNLYLLTVADIRSVSSEAWTTWKAGLLEALYRNTAEWLEARAGEEEASGFFLQRAVARAERVQREALEALETYGVSAEEAAGFLDLMPRRYLLNHGGSEVADHVRAGIDLLREGRGTGVRVFAPQATEAPFFGIVVFAPDRPGLLALMTGVLASSGHDILGAQIYTMRDGLAVQIYELAPLAGEAPEAEEERGRLERRLRDVLDGRTPLERLISGRRPRHPSVARAQPPSLRLTNEESDFYTIVDVAASDRPGLLHDITQALAEQGLDVAMARASTRANRANDSFYVTRRGAKVTGARRREQIERALLRAIEQGGS